MKKTVAMLSILSMVISVAITAADTAKTTSPAIAPADGANTTAPAIDPNYVPHGRNSGLAEGAQGGIIPPSDEEREYWDGLAGNAGARDEKIAGAASVAATWAQVTTTYYAQETSYSCGAACARMALKQLTGITYSESAVRTGCNTTTGGTAMGDILTYLNNTQSVHGYFVNYSATKSTLMSNIYGAIASNQALPIVGIKESTAGNWPYNLTKHGIVIHSVLSDKTTVGLCDPWAGWIGDMPNYSYDRTADQLYSAYSGGGNLGHIF